MKGKVKTWIKEKGFGFIKTRKHQDIFCHTADVKEAYDLDPGDRVEFDLKKTRKALTPFLFHC